MSDPEMEPSEDELLRNVALRNAYAIQVARNKAEEELVRTKSALEAETRILELLNATGAVLSSNLDLNALVQILTDKCTEITGAKFGAFFYTVTNEQGESFSLFTLSGAPKHAFERFGVPRATPLFGPTFNGDPPVRIGNVKKDARYGKWGPHYGMPVGHLPVCSYLAVPVISRSGAVLGGLFFGHSDEDVFSERHERIVVGVAAQAAIAIDNARLYESERKAAEDRKELLASERAARSAAERLSELKDEFLATLSHELRTPLSAILGWSQVLKKKYPGNDDLTKGLDTIERNARVQAQLIEDLLDMSRITSGKLRLDVQPIQPSVFIESAVETVRPSAEAKQVRVEMLLDHSAGPVSGDAARLQQVVWNLLSNAIKFTPKGGKVQILLERVNSHVEIAISDTGEGIRADFISHLFERFRQADASTTRKHGGLGLGLSIVKHLVEQHGGNVSAASPGIGKGATFVVQLPLAIAYARIPSGRVHPASPAAIAFKEINIDLSAVRVLVVDDEADGRELVERVLTECGALVTTASNATEALDLIAEQSFDVMVSDIGMPGIDGYELLRLVQKITAHRPIPAIALTAFARSEDRTRALMGGFKVHVSKPVEPSELVATVASVCRK